jgi:hypothetical protein
VTAGWCQHSMSHTQLVTMLCTVHSRRWKREVRVLGRKHGQKPLTCTRCVFYADVAPLVGCQVTQCAPRAVSLS